mmetsp:Transcript_71/g.275  ORF Transcript_71/g.275 Transcript_71/m.275 type:complete len:249 (-) Transcript_71:13-759(-)
MPAEPVQAPRELFSQLAGPGLKILLRVAVVRGRHRAARHPGLLLGRSGVQFPRQVLKHNRQRPLPLLGPQGLPELRRVLHPSLTVHSLILPVISVIPVHAVQVLPILLPLLLMLMLLALVLARLVVRSLALLLPGLLRRPFLVLLPSPPARHLQIVHSLTQQQQQQAHTILTKNSSSPHRRLQNAPRRLSSRRRTPSVEATVAELGRREPAPAGGSSRLGQPRSLGGGGGGSGGLMLVGALLAESLAP